MNPADRPTPETDENILPPEVVHQDAHSEGWVDIEFARNLEQRMLALREALEVVLASASPNPRDNPAMFPVWKSARATLAATKPPAP